MVFALADAFLPADFVLVVAFLAADFIVPRISKRLSNLSAFPAPRPMASSASCPADETSLYHNRHSLTSLLSLSNAWNASQNSN